MKNIFIYFFFSLFFVFSTSKNVFINDLRIREEVTSIQYYNFKLNQQSAYPKSAKSIKAKSDFHPSDWLKYVDGSRTIFSLSIPGTHETCARYGGPQYQCQEWTISEQLLNGCRYLDIRCRHINDCFMIHHGKIYQQLSFGSGVLDVCIDFLRAHPSEFIFMQIKEEYEAVNNTRSFSETMQSYINGLEEYFYLSENSPTLEKVRGKIVMLRRFDPVVAPQGNYLVFVDNAIFTSNTTIVARIQDCYVVPTLFDRSKKWEYFSSILNETLRNTDVNKLFVNFGSGTSSSSACYPAEVALYMTPRIGYYLEFTQPNAFVGVVLFDFVNTNYNNVIEILARRNYN